MARVQSVSTHRCVPLDQGWSLTSTAPGAADAPAALAAQGPVWRQVGGPATVAAALRQVGSWSLDDRVPFDDADHWFTCAFDRPERADDAAVALVVGGLATLADVWLNDQHLLHSENMFLRHDIDVGARLQTHNVLHMRFASLTSWLSTKRPRPRWKTRLVEAQNLRWARATLLGRIPAWSPPVAPVGPWRPVTLEVRGGLELLEVDVRASLRGADGVVTARVVCGSLSGEPVTWARLRVGDVESELVVEPLRQADDRVVEPLGQGSRTRQGTRTQQGTRGRARLTGEVRVTDPRLWWPHTHGSPERYPVALDVGVAGEAVTVDLGRTGFRTIEVDRDDDGFGLVLNGVPVFCRGACWAPLDVASLSGGPDEYRRSLGQVRDAGMNMVRVGGTMVYEQPIFHDLCDELGILVWQDFMFANMDYPDDPDFLATVGAEATQVLDDRQLSPSLAVLCGGSEVEQQAAMLGLAPGAAANTLTAELLPEAGARLRPDLPYVPSTPTGGQLPFHVDAGVGHYFGVGAYLRPLEDARHAQVRFAAECLAFSNVPDRRTIDSLLGAGEAAPSHPRWKERVPRDAGRGWDFEDVRDHYTAALFGVDPVHLRYADWDRYLGIGRLVTGEVMARVFSEWRRGGSTCRGGLLWLLRDLWPGAGWGVVDALGHPKAAYFQLRRVLAPVALLAVDEGVNGLHLWGLNDTAGAVEGTLRVTCYRGDVQVAAGTAHLAVAPRSSARLRADEVLGGFHDTTYAYRFGPTGHDLVAAAWTAEGGDELGRAWHFPVGLPSERIGDIDLSAVASSGGGGAITLRVRSRGFALGVAIDAGGADVDDNHFHLEPGQARTIALQGVDLASLRGTVAALNSVTVARIAVAP